VIFRAIFLLPYILGEIVAGLIWRYMYDGNYGVVAVVYRWFGQEAPQVLATQGWATAALLLVVVWKYFGFHMALFVAGRQGIGDDVLEAAKKSGTFDKGKLREVEKFMKDPAAWSKAHGGAAQAAE